MTAPARSAEESETAAPRGWSAPRWAPAATWAAILVGTLAPLARYWVAGLTLIHRDQPTYFAPLRWIAGDALREGRLPLWNPYNATGMPFLALMTHGALHPLSIAVAFLFPSDGLDPLMGAYFLFAGLGAGLFARSLGASRPASVLAAFAYALSGYMLSTTSNINNLTGTGCLPWIPLGLRLAARDRAPWGFALGALAVASCALSGDVQELALGVALGLALAVDAGGRRGAAVAALATLAGVVLGAIQLVPSWAFLPLTNRVLPLPAFDVNQWDLEPWRLVELVSPGFYWVPEEGTGFAPVFNALGHPTWFRIPYSESVFVGAATLLLAAAAVRRSRTTRVLGWAAVAVLWVSMGRNLGARALQDLLPLASGFRYGEKFLPGVLICVAPLAALGADRLAETPAAARRWAVAAAAGAVGFALLWIVFRTEWAAALLADVEAGESIRDHLLGGLPHPALALAGLGAALALAASGRRTLALAAMAAVVWTAAAAAAPYGVRPGHPEARIDVPPLPLAAAPPGPRVLVVQLPNEQPARPGWNDIDQFVYGLSASLVPNINARHGIDGWGLDSGFYPLRWFMLQEAAAERISTVARRFSVSHLFFPEPESERGKEIVARATAGGRYLLTEPRSGSQVWEVSHRPWASFPERIVQVADAQDAAWAVISGDDLQWAFAYVEAPRPLPSAPGRVLSVRRDLEEVEVVAEAVGDATLVVNDAYWPGWRAWIDGVEAPIFPADGLVRAVPWPRGRHRLLMRYEPPEVRLGAWVSVAGVAGLVAGCVVLRRRRRSGSAPDA